MLIAISELKKFKIVGNAKHKAAIISFIHETAHPSDIGAILDQCGVAIRAGNHCAQPLMNRLGISATARASFAMYNTHEDVRALINALHKVTKLFD
jgi:cysteine desulfurase/selenocysteine lyase